MRTQIEADLLLQNLMLTADAMGLGAWIHASIAPPVLLGDPKFRKQYGPMLGFDWIDAALEADRHPALAGAAAEVRQPARDPRRPAAQGRAPDQGDVPAELRRRMAEAVDAVVADKFGPNGIYSDEALFERIYKGEFGARYLKEASNYAADVIACARDICTYIYETHGRFPAHCDTIHVPGVWLQAHHVEKPYYEKFFRHGLTDAHRAARRALALGRLISPGLSPRAV